MPKAKKKLIPAKLANAKLVSWDKFAPKSVFPLAKGSRAGVVVNRDGVPKIFIFDTFALLDVLSEIDEQLVDRLSHAEYASKKTNPSGWLIGEIESALPLNPTYIKSLKDAIREADAKGWVPFEKMKRELNLA